MKWPVSQVLFTNESCANILNFLNMARPDLIGQMHYLSLQWLALSEIQLCQELLSVVAPLLHQRNYVYNNEYKQ